MNVIIKKVKDRFACTTFSNPQNKMKPKKLGWKAKSKIFVHIRFLELLMKRRKEQRES